MSFCGYYFLSGHYFRVLVFLLASLSAPVKFTLWTLLLEAPHGLGSARFSSELLGLPTTQEHNGPVTGKAECGNKGALAPAGGGVTV